VQGPALLHTIKENIEEMKKTYFSPEIEVVMLNVTNSLMLGSGEKDDITGDPVPVVDPKDDDDDGGW